MATITSDVIEDLIVTQLRNWPHFLRVFQFLWYVSFVSWQVWNT